MITFRNLFAFIMAAFSAGVAYYIQILLLGVIKCSNAECLLDMLGMLVLGYFPLALVSLTVLGIPIYFALKKIKKDNILILSVAGFLAGSFVASIIGPDNIIHRVMTGVNGVAVVLVFAFLKPSYESS